MNILMFTNTYLPHMGGVARSVSVSAHDLAHLGHRVTIVAPRFQGQEPPTHPRIHVLRVPAIQNFNGSDFSVRLPIPFALSERIEEFSPDLIHSHHPFLLGDTAMRVARQRELPLVFTHHTMYEWYTHYVPFASKGMQRFVVNLSTQYANMCSAVIAPSRSVAGILRRRGVQVRIEEIPTGIDLNLFSSGRGERVRREFNLDPETLIIGHVGRLAPEKNLDFLARAVSQCLVDVPGSVFLLTGHGAGLSTIQEIFARQGVSHRLIVTGKRSGHDLADVYAAMDCFAFASCTETQGLVLAEAMAASTPVVALDASGTREVVLDGSNGRLLPAGSTENAFAQALTEVLSNVHIRNLWRTNALETAKRFSRLTSAHKLQQLYESLSGPHTRRIHPPTDAEELLSWDALLRSLKIEWELISKKTQAVVNAVTSERKPPWGGRRNE